MAIHRGEPRQPGHRWFAATYDRLTASAERGVLRPLRAWVAGGAPGRVLDIGTGTGANFPYYDAGTQLVAVEPDPFMLARAKRRAHALGMAVEFHAASAEALPFPDASFDTVIATLVFCTVGDVEHSLAEVRRVLRPGGTFRFIEHVRAHGWLGRTQDIIAPAWRWCGAGCHPNRRTVEAIERAGFGLLELRRGTIGPGIPLIAGVATAAEHGGISVPTIP